MRQISMKHHPQSLEIGKYRVGCFTCRKIIFTGINKYFSRMVQEQDIRRIIFNQLRQFATTYPRLIIGLSGKRCCRSVHLRIDELPMNNMPSGFGKLKLSWCLKARISLAKGKPLCANTRALKVNAMSSKTNFNFIGHRFYPLRLPLLDTYP